MIVVLWGVSGCGKTTIASRLAQEQGWAFFDADNFHPPENVEKMRAGKALTDEDRLPWLHKLAAVLREVRQQGGSGVLACSALKAEYREILRIDENVRFVQLAGTYELIAGRLAARQHEFMNPSLLQSQFDALEEDGGAAVDITGTEAEVCAAICDILELR